MAWKESSVVDLRLEFVKRHEAGERVSDLCDEFGISRTTAYKFIDRYKYKGLCGLFDESKRPKYLARQTPKGIVDLILTTKNEYPSWGAAKIKEVLERRRSDLVFPVRSTVHEILDRHGLVKRRVRRRSGKAVPTGLGEAMRPNQLWCADFKGQFRTLDKRYCYPLTVTDFHSRYILSCEGLNGTGTPGAAGVFESLFQEHGLPSAIRTDNGAPFASRGLAGVSKLSLWFMRLGIKLERIEPGHPEQNGRHERMHLTLKKETTRPPAKNILAQQEKFDEWRRVFNFERPHEALDMKTPSQLYISSTRKYPEQLQEPEYPGYCYEKKVGVSGMVHFTGKGNYFFLSETFQGQKVGLIEEDHGIFRVSFMDMDLGYLDAESLKFSALEHFG